jgi:DNA-binding NarL/FixJ family response regulator
MACRDAEVLLQRSVALCGPHRVVVFSLSEDDEDTIMSCVEAGAGGYHLRSESLDELCNVVAMVHRGESACSQRVSAVLLRRVSELAAQRTVGDDSPLTSREEEILDLLGMGLSNREIADRLCIAVHTVKNHVHNMLTKLGVRSRAEAVARHRHGMSNAVYGNVPRLQVVAAR